MYPDTTTKKKQKQKTKQNVRKSENQKIRSENQKIRKPQQQKIRIQKIIKLENQKIRKSENRKPPTSIHTIINHPSETLTKSIINHQLPMINAKNPTSMLKIGGNRQNRKIMQSRFGGIGRIHGREVVVSASEIKCI